MTDTDRRQELRDKEAALKRAERAQQSMPFLAFIIFVSTVLKYSGTFMVGYIPLWYGIFLSCVAAVSYWVLSRGTAKMADEVALLRNELGLGKEQAEGNWEIARLNKRVLLLENMVSANGLSKAETEMLEATGATPMSYLEKTRELVSRFKSSAPPEQGEQAGVILKRLDEIEQQLQAG